MAQRSNDFILTFAQALAIIVAAFTVYKIIDHILTKGDLGPQSVVFLVAIINGAVTVYTLTHHVHERERDDVNDRLDHEEAAKHEHP